MIYALNISCSTESTLHNPFYLFMGRYAKVPDGLDFSVQEDEVNDPLSYMTGSH